MLGGDFLSELSQVFQRRRDGTKAVLQWLQVVKYYMIGFNQKPILLFTTTGINTHIPTNAYHWHN